MTKDCLVLKRFVLVVLLIIAIWGGVGGVRIQDPSILQQRADISLPLEADHTIEQTFITYRGNLTTIAIRMDAPASGHISTIYYRLIRCDGIEREVASGFAGRGEGDDAGYYFLHLPTQRDSNGARYLLWLGNVGPKSETVYLWSSQADEYSNGQALKDGDVLDGDIVFKLYYQYTPRMLVSDIKTVLLNHGLVVLVAIAILVLPGLALLSLLPVDRFATLFDSIALGVGVSIALIPIVLSVATTVQLHISTLMLWIWLGVCVLIIAIRVLRKGWFSVLPSINQPYDMAMFGLFIASLFISIVAVREMRFPLLLDSCHHTLITQLIIEKGQIPGDYLPYYSLDQFTYHFGFHSIAAFLSLLANLPSQHGVIITGQVLVALTGLTLYVMVARLSKSRRVAFFAATTVLLLNHIPAFYVNWGRYTQLAGQTLLPVFVLTTVEMFRFKQSPIRWFPLVVILSTGLFFMHYRVALFGVMFVFAYQLFEIYRVCKGDLRVHTKSYLAQFVTRVGVSLSGVLVLAAPWLWNISRNYLTGIFFPSAERVNDLVGEAAKVSEYFQFRLEFVTLYGLSPMVLVLAVVGLYIVFRRRDTFGYSVCVWIAMLIGGAYLYRLSLRLALYSMITAIIALYLPAGILSGFALDAVSNAWNVLGLRFVPPRWRQSLVNVVPLICLTIVLTFFGMRRASEVRLDNGFVRRADETAMQWIRSDTSASAKFFIASSYWAPSLVGGEDAGAWLTFLTGRETTVPVYMYGSDGSSEIIAQTNEFARATNNLVNLDQELVGKLKQSAVEYVYVGSRPSALSPINLLNSAQDLTVVYHQEGVWIFKVE